MILLYDEEKNSLLLIYLSFKKENVNTIFFLSRKLNKRKEFFKLFTEETNQESRIGLKYLKQQHYSTCQ